VIVKLGYRLAYKDDLEQHFLVDLHKFLVPLVDVSRLLAGIGVVICGGWSIGTVMGTPLDNLFKHRFVHLLRKDQ
jgi:hypothetical protein